MNAGETRRTRVRIEVLARLACALGLLAPPIASGAPSGWSDGHHLLDGWWACRRRGGIKTGARRLIPMLAVGSALAACVATAQTFESSIELTVPGVHGSGADVATDGGGNVVVVWWTDDDDGTFGRDSDIVFVRSADRGGTWSAPALIDAAAATDSVGTGESNPRILTDGQGTWLALWLRWIGVSAERGVFAARSTDAGETWSPPVHLGAGGGEGQVFPNRRLAACADGRGGWLVALPYEAGTSTMPPRMARSIDGGQTWITEPAPAGVVALARCEQRPVGLVATVSPDFTWSELQAVVAGSDGRFADGTAVLVDRRDGFADHRRATLAADPAGRLVATWEVHEQVVAAASESGTAWSAPAPLPTPASSVFNGARPFVANGGTGRWLIVWGGPRPMRNVLASSDGLLWAQVGEGGGWSHAVTGDGAEGWMATWHTDLTKQVFFGRASATTVTTTTTVPTTTVPPSGCSALDCTLDESLASGACAAVAMPRKISRRLGGAEKLLAKAAATSGRQATRRLRAARRAIADATALARRFTKGRRPKITAACSAHVIEVAIALRDGRCLPCEEQ